MGHLTGKTAIITGGGRAVLTDGTCGSIGYGIATAYAKEGANLVLTGRNMQKLTDAKTELEDLYKIKVLPIQADVSAGSNNGAIVQNVINKTIETFGSIDVLINNAQALRITRLHSLTSPYIQDFTQHFTTCEHATLISRNLRVLS